MTEAITYPVYSYATLLFISGGLAGLILVLAWPRCQAPGGLPLVWMMVSILVWCWTYALHWMSESPLARHFWLNATYFGAVSFPIFLLAFVAQITRQDRWLRGRNFYLLWIVPGITLLALWTDPLHGWFTGRQPGEEISNFLSGGPLFWVNVTYDYLLILLAYGLAVAGFIKSRGAIYRQQIATALIGLLIGLAVNIVGLVGFSPLPGLDLTPLTFTLISLFLLQSILGFKLLKIAPVALDAMIDQMQDGILVINPENMVIEMNHAAAGLVGWSRADLVGKSFDVFLDVHPEMKEVVEAQVNRSQVHLANPTPLDLEIQFHPLTGRGGVFQGTLLTLRDITQNKMAEDELRRINDILTTNLEQIAKLQRTLQEQAIRDPLTGLFNRRYLDEALPKDLARASRNASQVCLLMMDIDFFKLINDTYGHASGDLVLRELAVELDRLMRRGDTVCRYGGEEFLIVMVESSLAYAVRRAEQVRIAVSNLSIPIPEETVKITLSIGVSAFPMHGIQMQELLHQADLAMYRAKNQGRNRVCVAESPAP